MISCNIVVIVTVIIVVVIAVVIVLANIIAVIIVIMVISTVSVDVVTVTGTMIRHVHTNDIKIIGLNKISHCRIGIRQCFTHSLKGKVD